MQMNVEQKKNQGWSEAFSKILKQVDFQVKCCKILKTEFLLFFSV